MPTQASPSTLAIDQLREAVTGRVITAGDPEYDAARDIMLGGTDPRPAAIVRVANAQDVAAVIGFARKSGADLAVRSGGHSGAGHGTVDEGVVIDVRDLKALDIDVENRTAWAETGLTAGEVTTALSTAWRSASATLARSESGASRWVAASATSSASTA